MGAINPAFATYAIASTIVALHLILLAFYTGSVRGRRKQYGNPEEQPFRTIFFGVGTLSIIGMAAHVLRFYA